MNVLDAIFVPTIIAWGNLCYHIYTMMYGQMYVTNNIWQNTSTVKSWNEHSTVKMNTGEPAIWLLNEGDIKDKRHRRRRLLYYSEPIECAYRCARQNIFHNNFRHYHCICVGSHVRQTTAPCNQRWEATQTGPRYSNAVTRYFDVSANFVTGAYGESECNLRDMLSGAQLIKSVAIRIPKIIIS